MRYRYFDFTVESSLALPELSCGAGHPAIVVDLAEPGLLALPVGKSPEQQQAGDGTTPFTHRFNWTRRTGETICSLWRRGLEYRLHYPGFADYLVQLPPCSMGADRPAPLLSNPPSNAQPVRVSCHPVMDSATESLRHVLLSQVLPRVLGECGHLLLHASAVELTDGRQLVFAGISGQGKSTLAAWFHSHGARLLADDCVRFQETDSGIEISGAFPGLRLRPDSAAILGVESTVDFEVSGTSRSSQQPDLTKRAFRLAEAENAPRSGGSAADSAWPRLPRLFLLGEPATQISTQSLTGTRAGMELLRSAFNLDPSDPPNARHLLLVVGRLLARCRELHELNYPRDLAQLGELAARILQIVYGGPRS